MTFDVQEIDNFKNAKTLKIQDFTWGFIYSEMNKIINCTYKYLFLIVSKGNNFKDFMNFMYRKLSIIFCTKNSRNLNFKGFYIFLRNYLYIHVITINSFNKSFLRGEKL